MLPKILFAILQLHVLFFLDIMQVINVSTLQYQFQNNNKITFSLDYLYFKHMHTNGMLCYSECRDNHLGLHCTLIKYQLKRPIGAKPLYLDMLKSDWSDLVLEFPVVFLHNIQNIVNEWPLCYIHFHQPQN